MNYYVNFIIIFILLIFVFGSINVYVFKKFIDV